MRMYFKLHNLETYPECLPLARDILLSMLSQGLSAEQTRTLSILSLDDWNPTSLQAFIRQLDDQVATQWEQYICRRRQGNKRELFQTREEASAWLKQKAPLKLVDGAWLGHVHRVTAPFDTRPVTKDAWQVMVEEYGDGNLQMHHVYIYSQLLRDAGVSLPEAHAVGFIDPRHAMIDGLVWKAAVAQLLISIFPNDFLPEILGYNMHFELLSLETMMAARELEEVGLNAYYFFLHISIDNSHSGHTAMAVSNVSKLLAHVESTEGSEAAARVWKRVQAGFCLSSMLSCPESASLVAPPNEWNKELVDMFKAKSQAGGPAHCASLIKVDGQTLGQWLTPENMASLAGQERFLAALAKMKPWVRPGDSVNSRLIRELSWGGKMFGSFTSAEVSLVKRWIDNLGLQCPQAYLKLLGNLPSLPPPGSHGGFHRSFPASGDAEATDLLHAVAYDRELSGVDMQSLLTRLLPMWFTHQCVLEGLVAIPSRTANQAMATTIRVMRAYNGFATLDAGVAGMDEARRTAPVGIVEMGLHMAEQAGLSQPQSLDEVLDHWPCEVSVALMKLSMRPNKNKALLLGLGSSFQALHEEVLRSSLLPPADRHVLRNIVLIERLAFKELHESQRRANKDYAEFSLGRDLGDTIIGGLCRAIRSLK